MKGLRQLFLILFFLMGSHGLSSHVKPVRVALSSAPNNLNPLFSTDNNSQNIGRLTHLTLLDTGRDMTPFCRLCRSFKQEVLPTGEQQLHFFLRDNAKFWDGEPVRALHVKKAIEYFQSSEEQFQSIFRVVYQRIKKIEIKNSLEIILTYESFALDNLPNLNLLKIIKLKEPKKKATFENIVGSGVYRYKRVTPFEITLESLEETLPNLVFKVVKDGTTLALKLINQEIDLSVSELSARKIHWLNQKSKDLDLVSTDSSIYRYINVNHRKEKFKDIRVRKAISHLIPRGDIKKFKLKETISLSSGLISKAFEDFYQDLGTDEYNPALAEKLLDEAGFQKNAKGLRFTLDWKTSSNRSIMEIVEIFKQSLEQAGIQVTVTPQEWGTFMKSIKTGNFDIYTSQWVGFTGPEMFSYVFHSKNFPPKGGNRGFYQNNDLEKLMDAADSEPLLEKRKEKYLQVQRLVRADYAYIDLWHPKVLWIKRKCIKMSELYPNGSYLPLIGMNNECQ